MGRLMQYAHQWNVDGEVIWQNEPETKLFLTDTKDGLSFTMILGHDRLETTLSYEQGGRLMDRLSNCLVASTFEGRWEVTD